MNKDAGSRQVRLEHSLSVDSVESRPPNYSVMQQTQGSHVVQTRDPAYSIASSKLFDVIPQHINCLHTFGRHFKTFTTLSKPRDPSHLPISQAPQFRILSTVPDCRITYLLNSGSCIERVSESSLYVLLLWSSRQSCCRRQCVRGAKTNDKGEQKHC